MVGSPHSKPKTSVSEWNSVSYEGSITYSKGLRSADNPLLSTVVPLPMPVNRLIIDLRNLPFTEQYMQLGTSV